ncbi:MAG: hypothetical protein ACFWUC_13705 [Oscillospiraceae bacterium]|jgi:putative transposase
MSRVSEELLRKYGQKFSSTADVMIAMKDMFPDVPQQVMESELEEKLGYEKSKRLSNVDETAESKKIVEHWTCRCRNWAFGLIS